MIGFPLAVAEELGWRGWLQPRLQQRHGALIAALTVGLVWAVWHAPLHAVAGTVHADLHPGVYTAFLLCVSVLFAALYNATAGSVPVVATAHVGVNVAVGVPILAIPTAAAELLFAATVAAAVLASLLIVGTRGRLGLGAGPRTTQTPSARSAPNRCIGIPALPPSTT